MLPDPGGVPLFPPFSSPPLGGSQAFIVATTVAPEGHAVARFHATDRDTFVRVEEMEVQCPYPGVPPSVVLEQAMIGDRCLLTQATTVGARGESFFERMNRWEVDVRAEMQKLDMVYALGVMWDVVQGREPMTQAQIDAEMRDIAERRAGPKPQPTTWMRWPVRVRKGETLAFHLHNPAAAPMAFAAYLLVEQ